MQPSSEIKLSAEKKFYFSGFDIGLIFLLLVGLIMRLHNFHYPLWQSGEANRDYMVAHHILAYKEYILTGPWNGVFGALKNSPLYYYLIAGFLLIKDHILFLSLVSIMFQLFAAAMIYVLAKKLFSPATGLMAAAFFVLSTTNINQSNIVWHAYVTNAFSYLSWVLLLASYRKKSLFLLLAAIGSFIFGGAIHNSVFALGPVFIVLCSMAIKKSGGTKKTFLIAGLFTTVVLMLLYLPVLFYINNFHIGIMGTVTAKIGFSLGQWVSSFAEAVLSLFSLYMGPSKFNFVSLVALIIILVAIFFYFRTVKSNEKKYFFAFILVAFLSPLFFASFINSRPIWFFYFNPVFGLGLILLAELIEQISLPHRISKGVKALVFVFFVYIFSSGFNLWRSDFSLARSLTESHALTQNVIREFNSWPDHEKMAFDIEGYNLQPALIWVSLEETTNTKLVTVDDSGNGYKAINPGYRTFLVCYTFEQDICRDYFGFKPLKKIYQSQTFIVYLKSNKAD